MRSLSYGLGSSCSFLRLPRSACMSSRGARSVVRLHYNVRGGWSVGVGKSIGPKRSGIIVTAGYANPTYREKTSVRDYGKVCRSDHEEGGGANQLPKFIEPFGSIDGVLGGLAARPQGLPAALCDLADSLVTFFLVWAKHKPEPTLDPTILMSGPCAPVPECEPTACDITHGHIPDELHGVYLRNGPNPSLLHRGEPFHFFDGDGMLHSVAMRDGSASYCARFVQTSRFRQEKASGRPLFPKFFGGLLGLCGAARALITVARALLGLIDLSHGWGLSNTNVAFFDGHVLSLSEDGMPYIIRVTEAGDLLTSRQYQIPSQTNMCAHPKFDPLSGDMYTFAYSVPLPRSINLFRVSAHGVKSADFTLPLGATPVVHDFALTPRYIIFPHNQLELKLSELARGRMPFARAAERTPRFCLLRRDAAPGAGCAPGPAQWFDAPGVNCAHYVNGWEEGADEVVLIAPVLSPVDGMLEIPSSFTASLSEVRFNTRTRSVTRTTICPAMDVELGVINPRYAGRRTRYAYLAIGSFPHFSGVVKVDLQAQAVAGKREFAEGSYGGEPFFVAARGAASEDHGYLLCLVGDDTGGASQLLIMDALSPSLETVAAIRLPNRVPAGFHGCFINQEQLARQKP